MLEGHGLIARVCTSGRDLLQPSWKTVVVASQKPTQHHLCTCASGNNGVNQRACEAGNYGRRVGRVCWMLRECHG